MKTNFFIASTILCGLFLTVPLTNANADTYKYNPPGVKGITLSSGLSGKASVGDTIHVTCNIGYVGTKEIANNGTGPDAYLDANGNMLPYEIYAEKIKIGEGKLPGIEPPTKTLTVGSDWVVLPAFAGHQMMFKCIVDPLGKVHNSHQPATLTVLGTKKPPLQVPGPPQNMKLISESDLEKALPPKADLVVAGISTSIATPGRVQLQTAWLLPELRRQTHGRKRGTAGR